MLEIKTIARETIAEFDREVNEALKEGWELVKRECLPPYGIVSDRQVEKWPRLLYAELERVVEEPEEDDFDTPAYWITTRNPSKPLRCSNCGYEETSPKPVCPNCVKVMEDC